MLAPALRRHVGNGALDEFEQRLLHPFTRDVTRNGGAVALSADLVDFINVDDASLRPLDIVIRCLQELENDVFHIFADVPRFSQRGGIGQRERNIQIFREGLSQQRLACARRPQHEDVALLELHLIRVLVLGRDALIVVMHGHREDSLGPLLPHDVLIQVVFDFHRLFKFRRNLFFGFFPILGNDVVAEVDAFVTDVDGRPGNQFADFVAALSAERAAEMSIHLIRLSHTSPCYLSFAASFPASPLTALMSFGGLVMTSSMRPYCLASSADRK